MSTQNPLIVYVAMSADLIHPGHINILKIAREYADSQNLGKSHIPTTHPLAPSAREGEILEDKGRCPLKSPQAFKKSLQKNADSRESQNPIDSRESRESQNDFNKASKDSRESSTQMGEVCPSNFKGCASERAKIEHRGSLSEANEASPLKVPTRHSPHKSKVVVGLLTDKAIASYKRLPYMTYDQRKAVLESIAYIDEIIPQDSLSYEANIRALRPRFVIHGDDWKNGAQSATRQNVIDTLRELGCGELIEPSYTEGISSTQLNADARAIGISTNARLSLLRRLVSAKAPLRFIETHSAISALIAQNAHALKNGTKIEFDGFWSSSLTDSTSRGKPDIEAVELQSRLNTINEIFEVTSKPLIYDADTGGKIEHFAFTVRSLERTGVSACIIEDKTGLKKNSLLGNEVEQTQDSIEAFCDKIRAGKNAQITQDFMIIARIESLILDKPISEALQRAFAYIEAGADGIMIHSRQKSPNEVLDFITQFRAKNSITPIVVVPTSFNEITADALGNAGANIIIYANHLLRASFIAMSEVAQGILDNDRSKEIEGRCMSVKEILSLIPGTI